MAWVKLDDTFAEDPRWDGPGADGMALHVAVLCYCNRNLTDGVVSANRVKVLFPVADLDATVAALVKAGWWELDPDGIRVVGYLETQPSADQVRARHRESAERQERSRKHRAGDHSMCIEGWYCPKGAVTRDKTRDSTRESQRPDPSRPDPTAREGKGQGTGPTAPAPLGSQGPRPVKAESGGGFTITMPEPAACRHGLPWDDICLQCEAPDVAS